MIYRPDGNRLIAIGQPAHAWISGQLAQAWGSPEFGPVEPAGEAVLAAAQHDLGMAAFDAEPRVIAPGGPPMGFLDIPVADHLRLWIAAPRLALPQGRYVALLVSLHGTYLYGFRDVEAEPRITQQAIRAYLADQEQFRAGLVDSLAGDPAWARHVTAGALERAQKHLAAWDAISLALCTGAERWRVPEVPRADGSARAGRVGRNPQSGASSQGRRALDADGRRYGQRRIVGGGPPRPHRRRSSRRAGGQGSLPRLPRAKRREREVLRPVRTGDLTQTPRMQSTRIRRFHR